MSCIYTDIEKLLNIDEFSREHLLFGGWIILSLVIVYANSHQLVDEYLPLASH